VKDKAVIANADRLVMAKVWKRHSIGRTMTTKYLDTETHTNTNTHTQLDRHTEALSWTKSDHRISRHRHTDTCTETDRQTDRGNELDEQ